MSHTISLPFSRYSLAGFLSLLTTLVMFLVLFRTINTSSGIIVVPTPLRPPIFTTLEPPDKPPDPVTITKPQYNPAGPVPIRLPPTVDNPPDPWQKVPRPDGPFITLGTGTGKPPAVLEGELQAIVKVPPVYPINAETRGLAGYVVVEYSVTAHGGTSDIRVVAASPEKIFNQATIDAVAKFKFKPRVVDGKAVATRGLREKIIYELK